MAAFVYASAGILVTAHGGKTAFFLTDALDSQYIYNAARNAEIAVWLLSSKRHAAGQPLLSADEITEHERNLSFERELSKVIGRLDLLAEVLTEKYRRAVISYGQNPLGDSFLQFLHVKRGPTVAHNARAPCPPKGAAAPAVWQSRSRGPCLKGIAPAMAQYLRLSRGIEGPDVSKAAKGWTG